MKRVVTGHDKLGKSICLSDGEPPRRITFNTLPGLEFVELWATGAPPSVPVCTGDPTLRPSSFVPGLGETNLRIITTPPEGKAQKVAESDADSKAIEAEIRVKIPGLAETVESDFRMHTTETVDYGIVLSGEIWLELDDGKEVPLEAGDCVIQNGTRHGWTNRGSVPCVMAFVMIGARRDDAG